MKKLKKLSLESLSNSKFYSLEGDQLAKLTGGTTYSSSNTATAYPNGKGPSDDGKDEVD